MKNTIEVWDLTFYKVDKNGEPIKDGEGNVIVFDAPNVDCSAIAERVTDDCLIKRPSESNDY